MDRKMDQTNPDRKTLAINWTGPYSWPRFEPENHLPSIPKHPGIYLLTFEYQVGFLVYAAGLTRRPIPTRIREHTRKYMSGDYNVLDIDAMQQGIRKEIWHGWGWTPVKEAEFEKRKLAIQDATRRQLIGFRIFVSDTGTQPRILERLEASIMVNLYLQPAPLCDIPDKGMMLAPRKESEIPITVENMCGLTLYGLSGQFEI